MKVSEGEGNFHVSLGHLTVQEQEEQLCQLFWLSVGEAISVHIRMATSPGVLSTRTAKGGTGGVKYVAILPQNVFLSRQLSVVWGVPESHAACL